MSPASAVGPQHVQREEPSRPPVQSSSDWDSQSWTWTDSSVVVVALWLLVGSWSLLGRARSDRLVGGWRRSPGGGHDDFSDDVIGHDVDDWVSSCRVALITWRWRNSITL